MEMISIRNYAACTAVVSCQGAQLLHWQHVVSATGVLWCTEHRFIKAGQPIRGSESAEFLYKITDCCAPESERCIAWDDPVIGIDWQLSEEPLLSGKDRQGKPLSSAEVFA